MNGNNDKSAQPEIHPAHASDDDKTGLPALQACPHCGETASLDDMWGDSYVKCQGCYFFGPSCEDPADAVDVWNRIRIASAASGESQE